MSCAYPTRRGQRAISEALDLVEWAINTPATSSGSGSGSESQSLTPPPARNFSEAAAVSFLAPRLFQQAQLQLPHATVPVPDYVAACVGDAVQVRATAARFFETTHRWMPIISKRRFFTILLNPLSSRRCELTLVALCMKLSTAMPPREGEVDVLYRTVKGFFAEVEAAGVMSVHVLQAAVCISMYEMGQAIYPAAFLTVGWCARYGVALGADRLMRELRGSEGGDGVSGEKSWLQVEEMRRTWWAVLILDR